MAEALAGKLEELQRKGGIRARDVAQLLNTTPHTVSRWQTGRTEPQRENLERLLLLAWLIEQLSSFYSAEEAKLWLYSPHVLLQGATPANLIRENREAEVLALIDQLKDGAYL